MAKKKKKYHKHRSRSLFTKHGREGTVEQRKQRR